MIELWRSWEPNITAFCLGYINLSIMYEIGYVHIIKPAKRYFSWSLTKDIRRRIIRKYEYITTYFGIIGVGFFLVALIGIKNWDWINYSVFWFLGVQLRNIMAIKLLEIDFE